MWKKKHYFKTDYPNIAPSPLVMSLTLFTPGTKMRFGWSNHKWMRETFLFIHGVLIHLFCPLSSTSALISFERWMYWPEYVLFLIFQSNLWKTIFFKTFSALIKKSTTHNSQNCAEREKKLVTYKLSAILLPVFRT